MNEAPIHGLFRQPWPEGDYRLWQMAWVVDDVIAAARRWVSVHGIGPFHVLPRRTARSLYRGRETTIDSRTAVAQAGPVQIELIQQFDDVPSLYRDLYAPGQSGFHHVGTLAPDYPAAVAHYRGLGYELRAEFDTGAGRAGFFDATGDFGMFIEVIEETESFVRSLAGISETCAHWDGTDPIRLLHRGGYTTPNDD